MINRRTIFLVDAAGAALSVVLLGIVVPACHQWIGMPLKTLRVLALLPALFVVYDLACYFYADLSRPIWLRLIMAANLGYCVLTLVLMGVHSEHLKPLGVLYFIAEQPVILALVAFQYKIGQRGEAQREP